MDFGITKHRAAFITGLCLCMAFGFPGKARSQGSVSEYQVKAAFLFNFIKFVEWPEAAFEDAATTIVIGIAGEDPFGDDLEKLVKDKTIRRRVVEVKRIQGDPARNVCHVLFIGETEEEKAPVLASSVSTRPILTVSEVPDFLENGGMINFVTKDNKVRFEINLDAAEKAGLQISSKLLNLAVKVKGNTSGH